MNTAFERTTQEENWLTPKSIWKSLGKFDLDPCASHYQDELIGTTNLFIDKLATHNNGIAFIFARTDTKLWQDIIFKKAHSILFIKGRIRFIKINGTQGDRAGAPSALIAFGESNTDILKTCGIKGKLFIVGENNA